MQKHQCQHFVPVSELMDQWVNRCVDELLFLTCINCGKFQSLTHDFMFIYCLFSGDNAQYMYCSTYGPWGENTTAAKVTENKDSKPKT